MKIKTAIILIFIFSLILPVFAGDIRFSGSFGGFNSPPEPRLLYPIYEIAVLSGKEALEFRWMNDFIQVDHFIFRLYKGYNMYAADVIYKKDISGNDSSFKVDSNLFEDGQVYTWSLIQVALGGEKSDKSFNSFKVIKQR